ncbi:unnamed protein product [Protopolystoma xenopodis]|uniref:Uncharacterized protein n=1 Tax=Protopolystoma xenopodis TaxID=117903 RepID=A0A448XDW9_9PLAT|nr:unnamed protein product [Protopolystoma xenopodis]
MLSCSRRPSHELPRSWPLATGIRNKMFLKPSKQYTLRSCPLSARHFLLSTPLASNTYLNFPPLLLFLPPPLQLETIRPVRASLLSHASFTPEPVSSRRGRLCPRPAALEAGARYRIARTKPTRSQDRLHLPPLQTSTTWLLRLDGPLFMRGQQTGNLM